MFKRAQGTSPQSVQMAARLRLARELLRAGKIPINAVAQKSGFEDASHFARVFKSDSGLTPREYQALARKT
jgi:AraC-like DNA-binding protein